MHAGLAVKVTDGFFLVGLSNVDADRTRNIQLLKERSWFDVPLVYANQRRAIIAIEKGTPAYALPSSSAIRRQKLPLRCRRVVADGGHWLQRYRAVHNGKPLPPSVA
jgi:hypothetical protein